MLTVEDATRRILAHCHPLDSEEVPLTDALGRVLRQDVVAREALPPFANSAMDGYALRSDDTGTAASGNPARLRLVGEVPAGSIFGGTVGPGEAVRILTGAAVPASTDAVLQQELVRREGDWIVVEQTVARGNNIREPGEDVAVGTRVLTAGSDIGPAEIALLAALGMHPVRVGRRPRVAIIATGDELARLGETPQPGQIRESNSLYLAAAVERAGGSAWLAGMAPDQIEDLRTVLRGALNADLILTSGGVSVGDYDLVKQVLGEEGGIDFWRVRMRPGKPLAFGLLGETPLLGLPGNPVSAAVTFELFGRPAIRTMLGAGTINRPRISVTYEGAPQHRSDRRHYVRVVLHARDGRLVARPTGNQGSHVITSLHRASALMVIEEGEGEVASGEVVPALLLNDAMPWSMTN